MEEEPTLELLLVLFSIAKQAIKKKNIKPGCSLKKKSIKNISKAAVVVGKLDRDNGKLMFKPWP